MRAPVYVCRALIVSPDLPITRPTMLFGQSTVAVALFSCDVVCGPAGCAGALSMVVQLQFSFLERMRDTSRHACIGFGGCSGTHVLFFSVAAPWLGSGAFRAQRSGMGRRGCHNSSTAQHWQENSGGDVTAPVSVQRPPPAPSRALPGWPPFPTQLTGSLRMNVCSPWSVGVVEIHHEAGAMGPHRHHNQLARLAQNTPVLTQTRPSLHCVSERHHRHKITCHCREGSTGRAIANEHTGRHAWSSSRPEAGYSECAG